MMPRSIEPDEIKLSDSDQNEISLTKKNGMDQRQVEFALEYIFSNCKDIYIVSISELSQKIDLSKIKNDGYHYVGFSYNLNDKHQVAVFINLDKKPIQVTIYDSEPNASSVTEKNNAITRLNDFLSNHKIDISNPAPPFKQLDNWSCGVHVVYFIQHAYDKVKGNEVKSENSELDVHKLLPQYYCAYKSIEKKVAELPIYKLMDLSAKKKELAILNRYMQDIASQDNVKSRQSFGELLHHYTVRYPEDMVTSETVKLFDVLWNEIGRAHV